MRVFRRATARFLEALEDKRIIDADKNPRKISGNQAAFDSGAHSPPMQAQAMAPVQSRMAKSAATHLFASFSDPAAAPLEDTISDVKAVRLTAKRAKYLGIVCTSS